jgi:hypothetical protein
MIGQVPKLGIVCMQVPFTLCHSGINESITPAFQEKLKALAFDLKDTNQDRVGAGGPCPLVFGIRK